MSSPSKFPVDQLVAEEGVLEGSIRWGEAEGDDPLLLHAITLHLGPLHIGDEVREDTPKLRLHSIRFPVRSWAELGGQSFRFPNVVRRVDADGESKPIYDIYGSLKIDGTYHEVVPSLVRIGPIDGCSLGIHLEAVVNPNDTPPSFASATFSIDTEVSVSAVRLVGDSATHDYPSLSEATELSDRLLDSEKYEAPVVKDGCVILRPLC